MSSLRMADPIHIRSATEDDAAAVLAIYRPFVEASAISFETVAPTIEDFSARIRKALTRWQWLVAEEAGTCLGYAYGSSHRERAAYRWSVEVSVYVQPSQHRRGIGRSLYSKLIDDLVDRGFCNAYAGVTLPNDASIAMHRSLGFDPVGTFPAVGRKFGRWHDVAWFHRRLQDSPPFE
jgi:L-amino acid N-acyltransferase YncA